MSLSFCCFTEFLECSRIFQAQGIEIPASPRRTCGHSQCERARLDWAWDKSQPYASKSAQPTKKSGGTPWRDTRDKDRDPAEGLALKARSRTELPPLEALEGWNTRPTLQNQARTTLLRQVKIAPSLRTYWIDVLERTSTMFRLGF